MFAKEPFFYNFGATGDRRKAAKKQTARRYGKDVAFSEFLSLFCRFGVASAKNINSVASFF